MNRQNKYTIILTLILLIVQSKALLGYINMQKYLYLSGLVAFTLIFVAYVFFQIKYRIYMSPYILSFVTLSIIGNSYVGEYMGLYYSSNVYDKILHVLGSYAYALFAYAIITHFFPSKDINTWHELLYIFALGTAFGMAIEIIEFLGDLLIKPKIPN